jgi:hypothetical protein
VARQVRPHRLLVKLTDAEHEALEARAHTECVPMADVLRAGIARGHQASPDEESAPASLSEAQVLEIIEQAALRGSWQTARWLLEHIDRMPTEREPDAALPRVH